MITMSHWYTNELHRRDLLREAARERLIRAATARPGARRNHWLARLGRALVKLGTAMLAEAGPAEHPQAAGRTAVHPS